MNRFSGTVLDPDLPNVIRFSRIGMMFILSMVLLIQGMIFAL